MVGVRSIAAAVQQRPVRVAALLAALWALNVLDLGFTLVESERPYAFVELNPLARPLLSASAGALVAYKLALIGIGSHILLRLRQHPVAERAAWMLVGAYGCMLAYWGVYFMTIAPAFFDPAR